MKKQLSKLKMLTKTPKIVSKKIRNSARGEACTLRIPGICNGNRETTIFAHINTSMKGVGNKSPDLFGVYACSGCHDWMDGRIPLSTLSGRQRRKDKEILRAYVETLIRLYQKGLIQIK